MPRFFVRMPNGNNKAIGFAHRQRTQQRPINQAEDCSIRPDSQRQSEDRGEGKAHILAECPQPEASVFAQVAQPTPAPKVAGSLAYQSNVAELTASCRAGFGGICSPLDPLANGHLEMLLQFVL